MKTAVPQDTAKIRAAIEAFLRGAREPALLEPGEELLPLTCGHSRDQSGDQAIDHSRDQSGDSSSDNYSLEMRGSRLTLQAWDRTRNWTRRIIAIVEHTPARLEMTVEHFARREGQLFLLDLARHSGAEMGRRSGRLVFRERFRLFLKRQFPEWNLAEVSAEFDLQHSLSPAFPRAFLKHGQHGWAAIACPDSGDPGAVLSFGLIWLAYLRTRERRVAIEALAVYVPAGKERAAALRLLCLDPKAARFELFTYDAHDFLVRADVHDYGNLDTRLEPCSRPDPNASQAWRHLTALPGVESIRKHDGRTSLRVRGIEFAELTGNDLLFGLDGRRPAREHHAGEIARLAEELNGARSAGGDPAHPLYRQYPEAWLESISRAEIETLDATLRCDPVYGQVPAFAAGERGVLDLLAVDRAGRLVVIELKASADLHLPLQALDYWIRVKWHLDRNEFTANGYFPGIALRPEPPRLLLVSPALEFHPTTETIMGFFSPDIEVERIGLAVEWRKGLRVMFRLRGARPPQ